MFPAKPAGVGSGSLGWRPGIADSSSWTLQMPLDVPEELRTWACGQSLSPEPKGKGQEVHGFKILIVEKQRV